MASSPETTVFTSYCSQWLSDWDSKLMTEKGSSVSLFLLHQNSKEKHQSGMRTLFKRVWPTYGAWMHHPEDPNSDLKCGSFQAQESVLAVIEILLIALHVYHGWTMLQLSSHWVPVYICRFCSEEHHPSIKYQSIKCLKLATVSQTCLSSKTKEVL